MADFPGAAGALLEDSRFAISIVVCFLPPAGCLLVWIEDCDSLYPPQAALRLRPPGLATVMLLTTKAKLFARDGLMSPSEFLGTGAAIGDEALLLQSVAFTTTKLFSLVLSLT